MRESLEASPWTDIGIGSGKVTDIGPLVMGNRLRTRKSNNAYSTLIYNKGGLVLRMLHFLFADYDTGDDEPFFAMMKDFVNRNRDGWVTTESFVQVANEHFPQTYIARKFGMKNLDWFFVQWVWQTALPVYRLEYWLEDQPKGAVLVKGLLFQDSAPDNWVMPLPLAIRFSGKRVAHTTVLAFGPRSEIQLTLPERPSSIQLDPDLWVLSSNTSTKRR